MKKYIFTETQVKKIIQSNINEQYGDTDLPEDVHYIQKALNDYFKNKNIRGVWGGSEFKLNPKGNIISIKTDGDSGPQTKSALMIFQKNSGLNVDGEVGCKTTKELIKQGFLSRDLWGKLMDFFGWGPQCN
jgi:peptidoglycan hydrolase-like protein with peptidoglycan-binding domain